MKVAVRVSPFLAADLTVALLLCLASMGIDHHLALMIAPEVLLPILGIAISIFISFRNNQAYSRWWEARSLWGVLNNQSRNFRDNLHSQLGGSSPAEALKRPFLLRQVFIAWALNHELRYKFHPHPRQAMQSLSQELGCAEMGSQDLLVEQSLGLETLYRDGQISDEGRIQLQRVLDELCSAIGGLEKVRNQPFPAAYDVFIRLSSWMFGYLFFVRIDATSAPLGSLMGYLVFAGFLIAERLGAFVETPFFDPVLALPMNRMCATITRGLLGPSHPLAVPPEGERSTVWT